jgi:predicted nucleotidyltransferase
LTPCARVCRAGVHKKYWTPTPRDWRGAPAVRRIQAGGTRCLAESPDNLGREDATALDIEPRREALECLCREHGVQRFELFGSAASDRFDPARSDIDFIVEFGADAQAPLFGHDFELKQSLEPLFDGPVALVMAGAMTYPCFIATAEKSRRAVFASPVTETP